MRTSSKYFLRLNDIDPERYDKYDEHTIINTAIRSWNKKPMPFLVGNSSEKWLENGWRSLYPSDSFIVLLYNVL